MFANQVTSTGKINDFSCANFIWNKIKSKRWTWEELDTEFRINYIKYKIKLKE